MAFCSVEVTAEGVRGFGFWWFRSFVYWGDITSVRYRNICGLRYLTARDDSTGHTVWIPLFLKKPSDFVKFVSQLVPGNVVAEALKERFVAKKAQG